MSYIDIVNVTLLMLSCANEMKHIDETVNAKIREANDHDH